MNKLNPIWVLFSSDVNSMVQWIPNRAYIHIKSPSDRIQYMKHRQDFITGKALETAEYLTRQIDDDCGCETVCKKCYLTIYNEDTQRAEHGVHI